MGGAWKGSWKWKSLWGYGSVAEVQKRFKWLLWGGRWGMGMGLELA